MPVKQHVEWPATSVVLHSTPTQDSNYFSRYTHKVFKPTYLQVIVVLITVDILAAGVIICVSLNLVI